MSDDWVSEKSSLVARGDFWMNDYVKTKLPQTNEVHQVELHQCRDRRMITDFFRPKLDDNGVDLDDI